MKGIKCCGECAYYSMKKHKCTRGFTAGMASDIFFTDCDLPDVEIVKHGRWIRVIAENYECSECKAAVWSGKANPISNYKYCWRCGARMDGDEEE